MKKFLFYFSLFLLATIILIGWFYWFQWRPQEIRKDCGKASVKTFNEQNDITSKLRDIREGNDQKTPKEEQDEYNYLYETCLKLKGVN